jgi:hypothetical protein
VPLACLLALPACVARVLEHCFRGLPAEFLRVPAAFDFERVFGERPAESTVAAALDPRASAGRFFTARVEELAADCCPCLMPVGRFVAERRRRRAAADAAERFFQGRAAPQEHALGSVPLPPPSSPPALMGRAAIRTPPRKAGINQNVRGASLPRAPVCAAAADAGGMDGSCLPQGRGAWARCPCACSWLGGGRAVQFCSPLADRAAHEDASSKAAVTKGPASVASARSCSEGSATCWAANFKAA